jgi:2-phospho-L-lactate/phosphoenolpyruvate guanylyltransferase
VALRPRLHLAAVGLNPGYDLDVDARRSPARRIVAIVPVGFLEGAKSRLGGTLDAEERRDLVVRMLRRTLAATTRSPRIDETIVVTPDDEVREIATAAGARPIRQRAQGLNAGLRDARDDAVAGGADAVLIVPIDLPLVSPGALDRLLGEVDGDATRGVALVSDRHRRGTNALLLSPPDVIEFGFGGDSRACHESAARAAGARYVEVDGPLTVDIDTPDDLLLAQELAPEAVDAV